MAGEPAKERLFDVLMRRLDALKPYKLGVESIYDWTRRDPIAAASINRLAVNSMRFMLEAAGIDTEGAVGAVKLQGLALAWGRILPIWFRDDGYRARGDDGGARSRIDQGRTSGRPRRGSRTVSLRLC